jgi:transketolase C-terminal domain/subunit
MTMAYDPHREWTDGLTVERIRENNLTWALAQLAKAVAAHDAAQRAVWETLGQRTEDGYSHEQYEDVAHARDMAAHNVILAARFATNNLPA